MSGDSNNGTSNDGKSGDNGTPKNDNSGDGDVSGNKKADLGALAAMSPALAQASADIALGLAYHLTEIHRSWKSCGSDRICRGEKLMKYITLILGVSRPAILLSSIIKNLANRLWTKLRGRLLVERESNWESAGFGLGVYGMLELWLASLWDKVQYWSVCLKSGDCDDDDMLIWIKNMKYGYCGVKDDDHEVELNLEEDDDEIEDNVDLCSSLFNELPLVMLTIVIWLIYALSLAVNDDDDVGPLPPAPSEGGGRENESESDGGSSEEKNGDAKKGSGNDPPGNNESEQGSGVSKEAQPNPTPGDNQKAEEKESKDANKTATRKVSTTKTRAENEITEKKKNGESKSAGNGESSNESNKSTIDDGKKSEAKKKESSDSKKSNKESRDETNKSKNESVDDSTGDAEKGDGRKKAKGVTDCRSGGNCYPTQEIQVSCPCCKQKYVGCFLDPIDVYCSDCTRRKNSSNAESQDDAAKEEDADASISTSAPTPTSPAGNASENSSSQTSSKSDPTQGNFLHYSQWKLLPTFTNVIDTFDDFTDEDLETLFLETAQENYQELLGCLELLCEDCGLCHVDHNHTEAEEEAMTYFE